jgi:hypothetical protein
MIAAALGAWFNSHNHCCVPGCNASRLAPWRTDSRLRRIAQRVASMLLGTIVLPFWLFIAMAVFLGIPNWSAAVHFWLDTAKTTSSGAATLAPINNIYPYFPGLLAIIGVAYLLVVAFPGGDVAVARSPSLMTERLAGALAQPNRASIPTKLGTLTSRANRVRNWGDRDSTASGYAATVETGERRTQHRPLPSPQARGQAQAFVRLGLLSQRRDLALKHYRAICG